MCFFLKVGEKGKKKKKKEFPLSKRDIGWTGILWEVGVLFLPGPFQSRQTQDILPGPRERGGAHSLDPVSTLCPSHPLCGRTEPGSTSWTAVLFLGYKGACEVCSSTWPACSSRRGGQTGSVDSTWPVPGFRAEEISPCAQTMAGPIRGTAPAAMLDTPESSTQHSTSCGPASGGAGGAAPCLPMLP